MPSGTSRIQTERIVDALVAQGLAALPNLTEARVCLDQLMMLGGDRAVFATCLLTLELALLKDARAREALPRYVGVLLEAFHNPKLANVLVAGSPELDLRWTRIRPVVADFVAAQQSQGVAIPPTTTPPPSPRPPGDPMTRLATPTELIEEIQEILEVEASAVEVVPSGPPPPPSDALQPGRPPPPPSDLDEPQEPETRSFWAYAEKALGRVPDPNQSLLGNQSFAAARSSDRSHLVRFSHDLLARFPKGRHARQLAAMTLLYVAGHEKERGLLGVNKERLKLIRTGLSLLGDPAAAGQVAVLFESDGPLTRAGFGTVVDLVSSFLAFCLREGLDPRQTDSFERFTNRASKT